MRDTKDQKGNLLVNTCEKAKQYQDFHYDALWDDKIGTCGEKITNYIYSYNIQTDTWLQINPIQTIPGNPQTFEVPSARYGHACVIVSIKSQEYTNNYAKEITRKYMYIYGSYSPDCECACYDMWRYEIPWAGMRYQP